MVELLALNLGRCIEVVYGFAGGLIATLITGAYQMYKGNMAGLRLSIILLAIVVLTLTVMWTTREIFGNGT